MKVGVLLPLTGNSAGSGLEAKAAVQIAADIINAGHPELKGLTIGLTPGLPNLVQLSGFVGHGFMMAPAVAERTAAWLAGEPDDLFERFNLQRFADGRLEKEDFIIG